MAQGHSLVHLVFFVTMQCFISTDIDTNLNTKIDADTTAEATQSLSSQRYLFELNHEELSLADQKSQELQIFELIKWGHLATFLL